MIDERMITLAEARVQEEIDAKVKEAQKRLPKQPDGFDGLCVDCSDDIAPKRVALGAITCITCQEIRERKDSVHFRKR